jgi:TRAP-type C4-dicarboxylate transport system substrate-binding protein
LDRKALSCFVAGVLLGLLLATAGFALVVRQRNLARSQDGRIVLKLGHGLDQNHPVHAGMVYMAERLREKSAGTVELQIFPTANWARKPSASNNCSAAPWR